MQFILHGQFAIEFLKASVERDFIILMPGPLWSQVPMPTNNYMREREKKNYKIL